MTEQKNITSLRGTKQSVSLIPKLRFKEFDGDWEIKKLGDNISIISGFPFKSDLFSESGNKLVIPKNFTKNGYGNFTDKFSKYTIEKVDSKYICTENDLLVLLTDLTQSCELLGKPLTIKKSDGKVLLNQRVIKIDCSNILRKDFLSNFFLTEKYHKIIKKTSSGSTVRHSSNKIIQNIKLSIPSIPEQQKIATFLTSVDTKIQQLTTKKQLLENYKKGIMQQLFSQQLRFKNDDGLDFPDWEKIKLKEFISNFIVPMRDKPKDLTGEIPWCRIEDFEGKFLSKSKSNQGVSVETVKKMNLKVYPINTLLVSCSANLGFCAIVKKELITNQTFIGLVPNIQKISIDYLYHIMKLSSRRLNVLSSGTTISYLSRKQFENFKIDYPSLKEQQKIANYLSAIDTKIENVQTQIEKTQAFKKGLLQQMFV